MKKFKGIRNKGFSLVELIIVVAIMVALVAVLAPNYIKYVQKSRDAVVENAAESVSESIKMFYTEGIFRSVNCELHVLKNENNELDLVLESGSFIYDEKTDPDEALASLKTACGFEGKKVNSDKVFAIIVSANDDSISMSSSSLSSKIAVDVEEVPEGN